MIVENMIGAFLEAIEFLFWILPKLVKLVAIILTPVTALVILGFLAVTKGWNHVFETLKDKWIDWALGHHWMTPHNMDWGTGIITFTARLTILLGVAFNLTLLFMVIQAVIWYVQLSTGH